MPALTEQAAKKHKKWNSHPNRKAAKHRDRLQTGNDTKSKRLRLGNGGTKAQRRTRTKGKEQKKTEPRAAAVTDRILWHRNGNPLLNYIWWFPGGRDTTEWEIVIVTLYSLRPLL